jgi:hypothetical protein
LEIFLNIVWLCVGLALSAWWLRAVRRGDSDMRWSTLIAVCLLVLLLFPVISMTDDLVAMSAPAETEHNGVRRHDAVHAMPVALLDGFILLSVALMGAVSSMIAISRVRRDTFAATLRAEFVRAIGVRPPPACVSA